MSQKTRATRFSVGRQGRIANVAGSGIAIMSDSSTRANPSMDDPSKPTPSSSASGSSPTVIATLFSVPRMSENQSRMNLTSCSRADWRTDSWLSERSFISKDLELYQEPRTGSSLRCLGSGFSVLGSQPLCVEVQVELPRMRAQPHRVDVVLLLHLQPHLDDIRSENAALQHERVVLLE